MPTMKHLTFYLDFISPYAYLAFEKLPQVLQGLSYSVTYKPILFASLLKAHGSMGPAEMPAKRDWTYRHVLWLAQAQGTPMAMTAAHPFNPIELLRLAVACNEAGQPNRWVCETIFRHVWAQGGDPLDAERLAALRAQLQPADDPTGEAVKARLKANSDEALARGAFGVPTVEVDGKLFWGLDALPMLRDCLDGGTWFQGPDWEAVPQVPVGIRRKA
jgi:2-hydroxychromene-2-carboxylate isomerase